LEDGEGGRGPIVRCLDGLCVQLEELVTFVSHHTLLLSPLLSSLEALLYQFSSHWSTSSSEQELEFEQEVAGMWEDQTIPLLQTILKKLNKVFSFFLLLFTNSLFLITVGGRS